jgi:hypothetical protein
LKSIELKCIAHSIQFDEISLFLPQLPDCNHEDKVEFEGVVLLA